MPSGHQTPDDSEYRGANSSATGKEKDLFLLSCREPTRLSLSEPGIATCWSEGQIWPAVYFVWSIKTHEFVINIKNWEKLNTKKPWYLTSLKTRKPVTTGSLFPHDDSEPRCARTVPYIPTTPCHALTPRPKAVLVTLPALLMSLKIFILIGTLCQWSQYFRIQTPSPKLILPPQAAQKFCQIMQPGKYCHHNYNLVI